MPAQGGLFNAHCSTGRRIDLHRAGCAGSGAAGPTVQGAAAHHSAHGGAAHRHAAGARAAQQGHAGRVLLRRQRAGAGAR